VTQLGIIWYNKSLMENEKNIVTEPSTIEKIKKWYRKLPDKKRYLEFITALLTIPVLLTVLLSNVSNLNRQKEVPTPTVTQTPIHVVTPTSTPLISSTPSSTPTQECIKQVGPIEIAYPTEATTITKDPVCLDIARTGQNYCSVVWSYRINGGTWSDYTNTSICMYGLPPGVKNLELRVQSVISGDATILRRTFTIAGPSISPPPASASGTLGN
jgi:hypothetical protein